MMRSHTKRQLDAAISELKRDGYSVLLLMFDKNHDEVEYPCICGGMFPRRDCQAHGTRPSALEVMCSETNDPQMLAAMAKDALTEMSRPMSLPETIN